MKEILDYIIQEWSKLSEAPLLFILIFFLAYYASKWRYIRIIDILSVEKEKNSKEILKIKNNNTTNFNGIKIFEAPKNGGYNYSFYEHFNEKIRNAKEIYITGDGFDCINKEGELIANSFIESFRIALDKGATVVRVETKNSERIKWAKMLANLKNDYKENFEFYILKEEKSTQMANVCVIDPNDEKTSTVEMMLSTQRLFGIKKTNLAGTAIFIEGKNNLALDLRRRILELQEVENSIHLKTSSEILKTLSGSSYYFAYGSNMGSEQMLGRCPSAEYISVGILKNHEIVFNRKGSYRAGGVASIKEKNNTNIFGIIWKISMLDLRKLDEIEDPEAYRRSIQKVYSESGKTYNCNIYKAIPVGNFKPDDKYLSLIIDVAKKQNLPSDYISYLSSFKNTVTN